MKEKKVAVIIGGSGGIGSALVHILAQAGWNVYATYRTTVPVVDVCITPHVTFFECDITSRDSITSLATEIQSREEGVHLIVNTATYADILNVFLQEEDIEAYEKSIRFALGGMRITKVFLPLLKAKEGMIVHMLSEALLSHPSRMSAYSTGKYALLGFVSEVGHELRSFGVRIVGLSPSFVETDLLKVFPSKLIEIERQKKPERKLLAPEDVASAVLSIEAQKAVFYSGIHVVVRHGNDVRDILAGHMPRTASLHIDEGS